MCSLSAGESLASSQSRGSLSGAFYLVSATTAEWHDLDVLRSNLPSDGSVRIVNRSDTIGTLVVAGPRSRELLGHLIASDLSNAAFPWLAAQTIDILGNPTLVLRVNYVGSLDGRYTRRWSNFREFTMHWRQPGRITACRILASTQWIPCGSTNAVAAGSRTSRAATRRMWRLSIDSCLYKSPPLSAGTRSFARRSAAPPSDSCPLRSTTKATLMRPPARRCCFRARMSDLRPPVA